MTGSRASAEGGQPETDRPVRELSAAARRALAEAEARRKATAAPTAEPEVGGRGGLDPARYGDWEVKGIASDF